MRWKRVPKGRNAGRRGFTFPTRRGTMDEKLADDDTGGGGMNGAIWNKDMECMKRADIEALQLERLKALVDYCDTHVEFYHNRLQKAG